MKIRLKVNLVFAIVLVLFLSIGFVFGVSKHSKLFVSKIETISENSNFDQYILPKDFCYFTFKECGSGHSDLTDVFFHESGAILKSEGGYSPSHVGATGGSDFFQTVTARFDSDPDRKRTEDDDNPSNFPPYVNVRACCRE